MRSPIAISLGAIPGALSRYYVATYFTQWFGTRFPYGTLFVNLTGAFVMGIFATYVIERAIASPDLRLLVAVGFLGSYTTFSTYALDTVNLWRVGNHWLAYGYWLSSAVLGVVALELGSSLARRLP
ncbi:MAG: fluoride efflux transporter CrcB [Oscillatoriales cyanobacterium C42_A2020_001]|nr:fluoride efflux transporter CrcB [Leptolyngbyaceae cyanobacterium C42_A2020_001]